MNGIDDNLRALLEASVGEPPRTVTVHAVRRRVVRHRAVMAGAATLVVALIAGLGVAVATGSIRVGGTRPVGPSHPHAGPPRFYLTQIWDQKTNASVMAVRATATGRITAVIHDPLPGARCGEGSAGFAAADHQTFFMVCSKWGINHINGETFIDDFLYRFDVTGSGTVTDLSPLRGRVIAGFVNNIAAAPDGSELAVEVVEPEPSGKLYTNTVPAGIFVINTKTGARTFWHNGPYVPGTLQYAGAQSLSFTRDGRELVVLEARCHRTRYLASCNGHALMQVRAYSPANGGGSLERGQVLLSGRSLSGAFITPDGSAVNAVMIACPRHGTCTVTVERIAIISGRVLRVLYRTRTGSPYAGVFMRFFSSDPSGRYLILDAGQGNARVNGWVDNGRLMPLTPANGNDASYETWSRQ